MAAARSRASLTGWDPAELFSTKYFHINEVTMSADTLSGSCCRTNFFAAVYTRYALLRPWSRPSLRSTTRRISPSGVPSRTSFSGRKEYVDISGDEPLPGERELPDLPDSPNKETVYVPKRRVRQKSALAPDNRRLVSAPSGDDIWKMTFRSMPTNLTPRRPH